jgi:hypothetical protein
VDHPQPAIEQQNGILGIVKDLTIGIQLGESHLSLDAQPDGATEMGCKAGQQIQVFLREIAAAFAAEGDDDPERLSRARIGAAMTP